MVGHISQMSVSKSDGGLLIWRTVQAWSENRLEMTQSDFARVFCSLRLHEFSVFRLQTISRYKLVTESAQCMAKLNEILFGKVEDLQITTSDRIQQFFGHTKTKLAELEECYRNTKRDISESSKTQKVTITKIEDKLKESSFQATERFVQMCQLLDNDWRFDLRLKEMNQVVTCKFEKVDAKVNDCNQEVQKSTKRISKVDVSDKRAHGQIQDLLDNLNRIESDMCALRCDIETVNDSIRAVKNEHIDIRKETSEYKIALYISIGLICFLLGLHLNMFVLN